MEGPSTGDWTEALAVKPRSGGVGGVEVGGGGVGGGKVGGGGVEVGGAKVGGGERASPRGGERARESLRGAGEEVRSKSKTLAVPSL